MRGLQEAPAQPVGRKWQVARQIVTIDNPTSRHFVEGAGRGWSVSSWPGPVRDEFRRAQDIMGAGARQAHIRVCSALLSPFP
jgi:hypothetical protein